MSLVKTRTKKKKARKSRFQNLWEQAERLKKSNQKLDHELNALLDRVKREVMPKELAMGELIKQMVEKQLGFAEKKSLSRWQRNELDEWIYQNLDEIDSMGLIDEDLRNAVARKHAREQEIEITDNGDLSPAEQVEQYYADSYPDDEDDLLDDLFNDEMMDDLFGGENQAKNDSSTQQEQVQQSLFEDLFEEFANDQTSDAAPAKKASIDSSVFKRLFRQTATALHPDKERDAGLRQEKHILMTSLLDARKNNDLITVLQLHQRFVNAEHSLSSSDQHELEAVLADNLRQQYDAKDEIINQSPLHAGVYRRFYAKSKKSVNNKIAQHLHSIEQRSDSYRYFAREVKTLKALKSVLEERQEQYRYAMLEEGGFFDFDRDTPF